MRTLRLLPCLLLLALLAAPSQAFAHKVNIFAYVDGANIVADCFFSKKDKVNHGVVSVIDAQTGAVLATGTTDEKGALIIPVPPKAVAAAHDLKLLLKAGEGHQGDTVVQASEFASLTAAAKAKPTEHAPAKTAEKAAPKNKANAPAKAAANAAASVETKAAPAATAIDEAALTRIVTQAVDQTMESKLAPVKRMLLESSEKSVSPTEVAGGIGYIVGLFGIMAFAASRRKDRSGK
ncbi:MAG: hypothetical protein AUJ49_02305 [Desulfovibrionaceae bacterium CG1_02_65_16]|nr:MAG: hypothetical protein AUJ49_02305 [Desulfovibrionaceae bacterium CG1_02_65_16]